MPLPDRTQKNVFRVLNGLLATAFAVELFIPRASTALDGCLLALAAAASIAALHQQLPLQNVLSAAGIVALIGGVAHGLSANPNLSLPFGPIVFNPAAGAKMFNSLPWTIPLLWIVAIFSSRGVSRIILRPWRKVKNYGFWLIGLTVILAVAFDVALEPYARHVKGFWIWQPTRISLTWSGASPLNFVSWLCVSLLMMLFITPSLIRKQPGSSSAPDYHPFALWLGALLLFTVGCARVGLWAAVGVDVAIAAITTVFAVRGAKW